MRVMAVVFGIGVLGMSQCWAHGHAASSGPPFHRPESAPADTPAEKPFHDWLQPENHKNPYETMSCPELYVLATQSNQSSDLAQAFEDKDCHAL